MKNVKFYRVIRHRYAEPVRSLLVVISGIPKFSMDCRNARLSSLPIVRGRNPLRGRNPNRLEINIADGSAFLRRKKELSVFFALVDRYSLHVNVCFWCGSPVLQLAMSLVLQGRNPRSVVGDVRLATRAAELMAESSSKEGAMNLWSTMAKRLLVGPDRQKYRELLKGLLAANDANLSADREVKGSAVKVGGGVLVYGPRKFYVREDGSVYEDPADVSRSIAVRYRDVVSDLASGLSELIMKDPARYGLVRVFRERDRDSALKRAASIVPELLLLTSSGR